MIIGLSRVHYGKDYLGSVIRSALPYVDRFVVLYTPHISDGFHSTSMACPDSREELRQIASDAAGNKLDWREGLPISARTALDLYPSADLAFEFDADEVIHPLLAEHALARLAKGELTSYCYRLPFWHHWRSFNYACDDPGWPARLYVPRYQPAEAVSYGEAPARIHHFGYARSEADMRYKWATSAHNGELRPDWWGEIWAKFPERLADLHPVCLNFWDAQQLDSHCLPPVLVDHPYAGLAVIS